ncbi:hypothetical protein NGRA_1384 [Nosema granulosis]|uniref:Uncharacterized protein n=1 Tax=Nosema granulosis TaxID=83296 RepID=A0A9P6GZK9_9MICR|nr:hypothetical protein NGRA_1384 [Nosema granulosis]
MFVLLYLVSLMASYLQYDKEILGLYKENFTKKHKALKLTQDLKLSKLFISDCKEYFLDLQGSKLSFGKDDIFIYGLIKKNNFEEIIKKINQKSTGIDSEHILINGKKVFFENRPNRLIVNYIFERDLQADPIALNAYDFCDCTNTPTKINLKRVVLDYRILSLRLVQNMRYFYFDGKLSKIGLLVEDINHQELKDKHREIFDDFTDKEFNKLILMVWAVIKNNKDDFDEEFEIAKLIEYIKKTKGKYTAKKNTSEGFQGNAIEMTIHDDYFMYFRFMMDFKSFTFKNLPFNLSYFKPDSIENGPISIYRAISYTFKDNFKEASVKCFDSDKNMLEIVQKYTIFNNRVIILYDDIENISYIKIKVRDGETDFIETC